VEGVRRKRGKGKGTRLGKKRGKRKDNEGRQGDREKARKGKEHTVHRENGSWK
jgi:hypothetical protein